ncbi:MAG: hypothetical protein UW76_C0030G0021 [Parcubacteria group bacterium GW2011_GWF2_44_8b]|nr:MAG: hypothetical protein UW76_C0030G0021 [Parcubacteria group bacterium GW2011_GWF2_44_8b]
MPNHFKTLVTFAVVFWAVSIFLIFIPWTKVFIALPATVLQAPFRLYLLAAGVPLYLSIVTIFSFIYRKIQRDVAKYSSIYLIISSFLIALFLSMFAAIISFGIFFFFYQRIVGPTLDSGAGGAIMIGTAIAFMFHSGVTAAYTLVGNIIGILFGVHALKQAKKEAIQNVAENNIHQDLPKKLTIRSALAEPLMLILFGILLSSYLTRFVTSIWIIVILTFVSSILIIIGIIKFFRKSKK